MNNPKKPSVLWLIALLLVISLIWAISGYFLYGEKERGTFGDMFGAVNALFSGLAFATLIYTTWMQREELALQREELTSTRNEITEQRRQMEQQSSTFELQRFESTFFALLELHGQIVSSMDITRSSGTNLKSKHCFKYFHGKLKKEDTRSALFPSPLDSDLPNIQSFYERFYSNHQADLGHYFRTLYHIFKLIHDSGIQNKNRYSSLARAQLSSYEQILLFYNCLSNQGCKKFKPLAEEFSLLENIPFDLLLNKMDVRFYSSSAYGEDYEAVVNIKNGGKQIRFPAPSGNSWIA